MRKILLPLVLAVAASFGQEPIRSQQPAHQLALKLEEYLLQDMANPDRHTLSEVRLLYPVCLGETPPNQRAQRAIDRHLARLLKLSGKNEKPDIDKAAKDFLMAFQDHRKRHPDATGVWFIRLMTKVLYASPTIVSLELQEESYDGGARPVSERFYFTFDAVTGEDLKPRHLFRDIPAVTELAHRWFRTARLIPDTADLRARGFRFPRGAFRLPENVALTERNASFYYNPGEVAGPDVGGILVVLPMREIKRYLKISP